MRLTLALLLFASPAFSQAQCANVAHALDYLSATYGESIRVTGLMADGNMLIITAAPSGGWTALQVKPGGEACMVGAGEGFGIQDAEPPGVDG
jgi:hypothetical protein